MVDAVLESLALLYEAENDEPHFMDGVQSIVGIFRN